MTKQFRGELLASASGPTLADVLVRVEQNNELTPTRRRDLRSAVRRMAELLDDEPQRIALDFPTIREKLNVSLPLSTGISRKTYENIRCNFIYAVQISDLLPVQRWAKKTPLTKPWSSLVAQVYDKRSKIVLSRIGRYASSRGVIPTQVDDEFIRELMDYINIGSLYRDQTPLFRKVTKTWNAVSARLPQEHLRAVTVPSFCRASPCVAWNELSQAFKDDLAQYLAWCAVSDEFDESARERALAPASIQTVRNLILYAVSALIKDGVEPSTITSLADLVSVEAFKRILTWRRLYGGGHGYGRSYQIASCLVVLAREWTKVDTEILKALKKQRDRLKRRPQRMSERNKVMIRPFGDPTLVWKVIELPDRLWSEAIHDKRLDQRTLDTAQCAIGIKFLTYMPIRRKNFCALAYDVHLYLRSGRGAISTLEIPGEEVKGGEPIEFDIPPDLANMLIEYREQLVPKIVGYRPSHVFIKAAGELKNPLKISMMISRCLKQRTGLKLNLHGFRHAAGKLMLDNDPGAIELVSQLLGHKSVETTRNFYTGIDTRRAGRAHFKLIKDTVEAQAHPTQRRKGSR